MVKVLVTGASGFIGSRLTEKLVARGDEVTCLVRASSRVERLNALGVRLAYGDARDADAVCQAIADAEVVYHLAGIVAAFRSAELTEVNVQACQHVVSACAKRSTPPTLVVVSSLAAAGPALAGRPREESDPPAPVSHYGRAKRQAEIVVERHAAQVPITIVRPPIVFGQGDPRMRDIFRSIFRYGIHLALGVSKSRYALIHVHDLVDALILCAQRGGRLAPCAATGAPRGYYFVAHDEQPTFGELGHLIGRSLGRDSVRVWHFSRAALWPAAALIELMARVQGQPHIFNFDKVREARAGDWTCSSHAIRDDVGFLPHASLEARLAETARWYIEQNLL